MDKINIVGNGPSRELWDGTGRSIGANHATDTDMVVIVDRWPIGKIMMDKWRPKAPIILGPAAWDEARSCNVWKRLKIHGVVNSYSPDVNAGQCGTVWALRTRFDVHLWGFDSLWTGKRTTSTDSVWAEWKGGKPSKTKAANRWGNAWQSIRNEFPEDQITVHLPEGNELAKDYDGFMRMELH